VPEHPVETVAGPDVADPRYSDAVRNMPDNAMARGIALTGFMGTGKTTVGRDLSARLGWPLVDTDEAIETRSKKTIRELFDWFGEAYFRELEREFISRRRKPRHDILSLGGGTFIDAVNRELLLGSYIVVYLAAPWPHLVRSFDRLKKSRPLLRDRTPAQLEELFNARHPCYDMAQVRVALPGRSARQVTSRVIELLGLEGALRRND
jgi:shikimate kinase